MLNVLATTFGLTVTACMVVDPGAAADRSEAHHWIDKALDRIDPGVDVDRFLIESESIPGGIA
jgi:hypothetical protein